MQVGRGERIGKQREHTYQQYVERELQRRHADIRLVDYHDIDGVSQRGNHYQQYPHRAERHTGIASIQQADTCHCQDDGGDGRARDFLAEERGHDDRHHHGIDEQNGGGNTGIHEVETLVIGDARCGKEQPE